jgi:putative membrane protein
MLPKPSGKTFFIGLLGGAADAVPGVSGGTVYYVLNVYEDLLSSLASCGSALRKGIRERSFRPLVSECAWAYLGVLGLGVITAFLTLAHVIVFCLETEAIRPLFFAVFFGLVLGSSFICLRLVSSWLRSRIVSLIVGVSLGLLLMSGVRIDKEATYQVIIRSIELPQAHNVVHNQLSHVPSSAIPILCSQGVILEDDVICSEATNECQKVRNVMKRAISFLRIDLILAGMVAVSAMLLPGISGSYLLQVLGFYGPVLFAIMEITSNLVHLQFPVHSWCVVLNISLGIVAGALLFSRTILWLFARFSDQTSSFLSGCMLGSIWSVWPYQTVLVEVDPFHIFRGGHLVSSGLYIPTVEEAVATWYIFPLVALSAFFVCGIERMAARKKEVTTPG